jgi:hypothetical protein
MAFLFYFYCLTNKSPFLKKDVQQRYVKNVSGRVASFLADVKRDGKKLAAKGPFSEDNWGEYYSNRIKRFVKKRGEEFQRDLARRDLIVVSGKTITVKQPPPLEQTASAFVPVVRPPTPPMPRELRSGKTVPKQLMLIQFRLPLDPSLCKHTRQK